MIAIGREAYTREFPFVWEEMAIPFIYEADRNRVERIMLDAATEFAGGAEGLAAGSKERLEERFGVASIDLDPRVFYRITDN